MTLDEFYSKNKKQIERLILLALAEDRVMSDVTTKLLFTGKAGDKKISASLLCKEDCIVAGLGIFQSVYKLLDNNIQIRQFYKDGDKIKKNAIPAELKGSVRSLLRGERTALNFIQRMSGIATTTRKFVDIKKYKHSKILPTRKTTPNFRIFELMAVKIGGGDFHRSSLASAVMIKDNHIASAGSLNSLLDLIKDTKLSAQQKYRFEIEVKNFGELKKVLKYAGIVKIILLDNFTPEMITKAAHLIQGSGIKIEISGGINFSNFSRYQHKSVDFYSIGMLTHSYKSIDFSLEFKN